MTISYSFPSNWVCSCAILYIIWAAANVDICTVQVEGGCLHSRIFTNKWYLNNTYLSRVLSRSFKVQNIKRLMALIDIKTQVNYYPSVLIIVNVIQNKRIEVINLFELLKKNTSDVVWLFGYLLTGFHELLPHPLLFNLLT